jgi:hypothetical protein
LGIEYEKNLSYIGVRINHIVSKEMLLWEEVKVAFFFPFECIRLNTWLKIVLSDVLTLFCVCDNMLQLWWAWSSKDYTWYHIYQKMETQNWSSYYNTWSWGSHWCVALGKVSFDFLKASCWPCTSRLNYCLCGLFNCIKFSAVDICVVVLDRVLVA